MLTAPTSRALYYPYIRVPESPWFTRVLLYWDKVGAIVPYDYIEDPEKLGSYMVGLVREQLVEQIIPGQYLWQVRNFKNAFLAYVDRLRVKASPSCTWPAIHMEKLQDIGDALVNKGLATRRPNPYSPWYNVEPMTASAFMAYLASVLGQLTTEEFYPITEPENLTPFISDNKRSLTQARRIILDAILPSPSEAMEPARLADFKASHSAELRRFRRELEDKIAELSIIQRGKDRERRSKEVAAKLRSEVDELAQRMAGEKKWPRIGFADLCAVTGGGLGTWKAVIDHDIKFGLAGAALSIAPAVYSAFRGSGLELTNRPLAYAASAKLKFD